VVNPAALRRGKQSGATTAETSIALVDIVRGHRVREVSDLLPEEIDLLVYA